MQVLAALSVSLFGSKLRPNRFDFPQYFSFLDRLG
jgi:hypothetical protein